MGPGPNALRPPQWLQQVPNSSGSGQRGVLRNVLKRELDADGQF